MYLYIYDENIEPIGIYDAYASLIWIRRYASAGSFELYAARTDEAVNLLKARRIVFRPDVKEAMYINGVVESNDGDGGRFIRITGYTLEGLLRKRVIMVDGKKAVGILEGVQAALEKSPLLPIEYGTDELDTVKSKTERSAVLEDWVRNCCVAEDRSISYKIELKPTEKRLKMELYQGRDLSDRVLFGDVWGNLNNMEYSYSEEGCANVIVCKCGAVSEEGVEFDPNKGIPSYTLGDAEGLARTERLIITEPIIKDGIRVKYDAAGVAYDEEYRYISYDDTLDKMKEEAAAAFADYTENFSGDALGSGYRSEWDVGDVVAVQNGMRGISYSKRIEEVQETFDTSGVSIVPTFGEPLKTILDFIER